MLEPRLQLNYILGSNPDTSNNQLWVCDSNFTCWVQTQIPVIINCGIEPSDISEILTDLNFEDIFDIWFISKITVHSNTDLNALT